MNNPLVSISIPVYNRARLLPQTLQSALDQTYQNIEILCFDDCSTDDSLAVLHEFAAKDPRIKVIASSPNKGQAAMTNMGLDMAKGKYVAILDSDDICLPRRIERQVAFMEAHPEIGMCATYVEFIGDKPRIAKNDEPFEHELLKLRLMLCNCPFRHSSIMYRKPALDELNLRYNPAMRSADDYEMYTRISNRIRFSIVPEVLLQYRDHADSITGTQNNAQAIAAFDSAYKMVCRDFGLDAGDAEKMRFMYILPLADPKMLDNLEFVFAKFLEYPDFTPYRKEVKVRLLSYFYRMYRRNPKLVKQNFAPYWRVVKKYHTGYVPALKLYLKKFAK